MPSSNVLSKRVLVRRENKPPTLTPKKYSSLSPTGLSEHWVAMENTRAGRDVTCQYRRGVPRPCHLSQSHAWHARERISRIWTSLEPRGPGPGMVAPVWALTHCAHCAGERLARACNTRTRGRIRGQSGAQEDRARRRNLGEEMRSSLGTLRNLESSGRFL